MPTMLATREIHSAMAIAMQLGGTEFVQNLGVAYFQHLGLVGKDLTDPADPQYWLYTTAKAGMSVVGFVLIAGGILFNNRKLSFTDHELPRIGQSGDEYALLGEEHLAGDTTIETILVNENELGQKTTYTPENIIRSIQAWTSDPDISVSFILFMKKHGKELTTMALAMLVTQMLYPVMDDGIVAPLAKSTGNPSASAEIGFAFGVYTIGSTLSWQAISFASQKLLEVPAHLRVSLIMGLGMFGQKLYEEMNNAANAQPADDASNAATVSLAIQKAAAQAFVVPIVALTGYAAAKCVKAIAVSSWRLMTGKDASDAPIATGTNYLTRVHKAFSC